MSCKVTIKASLSEGVTMPISIRKEIKRLKQQVGNIQSVIDRWALIMEPVEAEANRLKALHD